MELNVAEAGGREQGGQLGMRVGLCRAAVLDDLGGGGVDHVVALHGQMPVLVPEMLLEGEVRVHDLDIRDIRLRLRPRPIPGTAGTDSAGLAEYFPTIRSRDPAAPAETPSEEEGDSLHLAIDDFHVAGSHEFWVHQARGHVSGDLRGSFSLDTGTGRIGLSGGELNLALTELDIGSDRDVTGDARIRGRIDVPPANIAELSMPIRLTPKMVDPRSRRTCHIPWPHPRRLATPRADWVCRVAR